MLRWVITNENQLPLESRVQEHYDSKITRVSDSSVAMSSNIIVAQKNGSIVGVIFQQNRHLPTLWFTARIVRFSMRFDDDRRA